MLTGGNRHRSIWWSADGEAIEIIDQRHLPHEYRVETLQTTGEVFTAIREMHVRGAPLIGVTAAYGVYFAVTGDHMSAAETDDAARKAAATLTSARPTAVNLKWAVDTVLASVLAENTAGSKKEAARTTADRLADEEVRRCREIGENGLPLLVEMAESLDRPLNILTHCNAGWLACVEHGTATAPIYLAHDRGIAVHVWVDETRPRNQGARLTAWELGRYGVPHTVIVDNAGGHLMQRGLVDVVIVGTDRTTRTGDVVNKIGTYLKALAAHDNEVPFYVALPSSSIDWSAADGAAVPIEERDAEEIRYIRGSADGESYNVLLTPPGSDVANYGFDVTPARFVTGLITERGICKASEDGLKSLFPEIASHG